MNEQLKQRLIGAAVLVSLAVIFIPALLDGRGDGGDRKPAQPDYRFEPLEIPLQAPPEPEPRAMVIDEPEVSESPEAAGEPAGDKPVALRQPERRGSAPPPVTASSSSQSKESRDAAEPEGTEGPSAWVVQVGSFSEATNALALRDKLRKQGFRAFVEKVETSRGAVYRVRVGPELKRETAEALKDKLEKKHDLGGIVMHHP